MEIPEPEPKTRFMSCCNGHDCNLGGGATSWWINLVSGIFVEPNPPMEIPSKFSTPTATPDSFTPPNLAAKLNSGLNFDFFPTKKAIKIPKNRSLGLRLFWGGSGKLPYASDIHTTYIRCFGFLHGLVLEISGVFFLSEVLIRNTYLNKSQPPLPPISGEEFTKQQLHQQKKSHHIFGASEVYPLALACNETESRDVIFW